MYHTDLLPDVAPDGPWPPSVQLHLSWPNASLRTRIVEHALRRPDETLSLAEELLVDREASPTALSTAVAVLGVIASPRALALLEELAPKNALARQALARMGRAVPPLREPDVGDRAALISELADRLPSTRAAAATQLAEHLDPSLLPALRAALDDKHAAVKRAAARTLGRLGDEVAFERFRSMIATGPEKAPQRGHRSGPPPAILGAALAGYEGLYALGDVRGLPELARLGGSGYEAWLEVNAVDVLGRFYPAGLAALFELADRSPGSIRVRAATPRLQSTVEVLLKHRLQRHAQAPDFARRAIVTLLFTKKDPALHAACVTHVRELRGALLSNPGSPIEKELAALCATYDPEALSATRSLAWS